MMKIETARTAMKAFLKRNNGKVVYFDALSDHDKLVYVMVKTYAFRAGLKIGLSNSNLIKHAIENAYSHKANGFEIWASNCTRFANDLK